MANNYRLFKFKSLARFRRQMKRRLRRLNDRVSVLERTVRDVVDRLPAPEPPAAHAGLAQQILDAYYHDHPSDTD